MLTGAREPICECWGLKNVSRETFIACKVPDAYDYIVKSKQNSKK